MSADPATLVKNAACLNCIPPAMRLPVLISLAYQILLTGGGGGGGGSGQIVGYAGTDPNSDAVVPTDQTKPAIAVKPSATTYVWDTVNLIWT